MISQDDSYERGTLLAQMIGDSQPDCVRMDDCGESLYPDLFDMETCRYVEVKERRRLLDYSTKELFTLGPETGLFGESDLEQFKRWRRMFGPNQVDLMIFNRGLDKKSGKIRSPGVFRVRLDPGSAASRLRGKDNHKGFRPGKTPAGKPYLLWHLADLEPVNFDVRPYLESVIGTSLEWPGDRGLLRFLTQQQRLL